MQTTLCRSALYMPADNPRAVAKGPGLPADAIVLDLEDSVPPQAKLSARNAAINAINTLDYGARLKVVRVNDVSTEWFSDDVALLGQCKPDALLLPKVEDAGAIEALDAAMQQYDAGQHVGIWAMMETPKAVVNAAGIAAASKQFPRLGVLCVGNNDLARVAGIRSDVSRELMMPWFMTILAAARAYGLTMLDGVFNNFADTAGFLGECEQAAAMGMDGKTLIHPTQIEPANRAFSPSEDDINKARDVVAAFSEPANQGAAVLQINGEMYERLHLDIARKLLERVP